MVEREPQKESGETCHGCGQTIDPKKANDENFKVVLRRKDNPEVEIPYHFDCLQRKVAQENK